MGAIHIFTYRMALTRLYLYRPAYIAGVCNPIFETSGSWDLLMDVGGGRIVVSKDIHTSFPPTSVATPIGPPLIIRTGTLKAEGSLASEDDIGRGKEGQKSEFTARTDSADNFFMEDVSSHFLGDSVSILTHLPT